MIRKSLLRNRASQRNRAVHSNRRAMIALLILSGTIISICMGLRQSLGLFIRPMTLDVGVSAAAFGFAIALQNIVWGISQPFIGALADKYGPRPVIFGPRSAMQRACS